MLWYISGLHFREMSMRQNSGEPQKAGNYACSSHTNAICSYWSITLNDQTWQLLAACHSKTNAQRSDPTWICRSSVPPGFPKHGGCRWWNQISATRRCLLSGGRDLMWINQCHKPPMTGKATHSTHKHGDDCGPFMALFVCDIYLFCLRMNDAAENRGAINHLTCSEGSSQAGEGSAQRIRPNPQVNHIPNFVCRYD